MFRIHHNSQKRIYRQNGIYFITTITYNRFPYFEEEIFRELFELNLKFCRRLKDFFLYDYVIDLEHIHLLIKPNKQFNISNILQNLKRNFSHNANIIMGLHNIEGDNNYCRLPNINQLLIFKRIFINKYGQPQFEIPQFKWQKSFSDHLIRNRNDFINHLNYIRKHQGYEH